MNSIVARRFRISSTRAFPRCLSGTLIWALCSLLHVAILRLWLWAFAVAERHIVSIRKCIALFSRDTVSTISSTSTLRTNASSHMIRSSCRRFSTRFMPCVRKRKQRARSYSLMRSKKCPNGELSCAALSIRKKRQCTLPVPRPKCCQQAWQASFEDVR